jgi:hypothetical protein
MRRTKQAGHPRERSQTATTRGRPRESGSRQQTVPGQTSSSGSPEFDCEATHKGGHDPVPATPPDAK